MYGGSSGCYGVVLYNTDIKGDNAAYGYYRGDDICIKTGPVDAMKALQKADDEDVPRAGDTGRSMVVLFFVYLLLIIAGFIVLPLKVAFALLIFCILSYFPLLIIIGAIKGLYCDPDMKNQFRRYHGSEHAAISALTLGKPADMETFRSARIYDTECGTAYSGYALAVALELALLIIFWPGLLKAAVILVLTIILIIVMILIPRINPFTLLQHPVVLPPTEREYILIIELMKKLRELE